MRCFSKFRLISFFILFPKFQVRFVTSSGFVLVDPAARDFAGPASERGRSIAIAGGSAGAHSNGLFNVEAASALNWLVGSVTHKGPGGVQGGVTLNPGGPTTPAQADAP